MCLGHSVLVTKASLTFAKESFYPRVFLTLKALLRVISNLLITRRILVVILRFFFIEGFDLNVALSVLLSVAFAAAAVEDVRYENIEAFFADFCLGLLIVCEDRGTHY